MNTKIYIQKPVTTVEACKMPSLVLAEKVDMYRWVKDSIGDDAIFSLDTEQLSIKQNGELLTIEPGDYIVKRISENGEVTFARLTPEEMADQFEPALTL